MLLLKHLTVAAFVLTASSCAPALQSKVTRQVEQNRLDQALATLDNNPLLYGSRNQLLYWLDRGMAAQLAGHFD
jgi:hypothetical protein